MGLFEIGLAEPPSGQKTHARVGAAGGGRKAGAKTVKKAGKPLHLHGVIEVGKGARQHQTIFERIACAGRGLAAVIQHPPAPIGTATEINGEMMQMPPARRLYTPHGPDVIARARNGGGRQQALRHHLRLTVEVGEQGLHQLEPLGHALDDLAPVFRRQN